MRRRQLRRLLPFALPLVLVALGGCLPRAPRPAPAAPSPELRPEEFFAGRTTGTGTLTRRFASPRTLRVESRGRGEPDGSFRLDQTVTYADGGTESRTWVMRRVDARRYSATLSDATGPVSAEVDGNRFHLRYLLRRPAVRMEQWLSLEPDGRTVRNEATVTILGVPWARLSERIVRGEGA